MPLSEDFVRSRLRPFEHRISKIIVAAWNDFLSIGVRHKFLYSRTRANIVFDLIAGGAIVEFNSDPNVRIIQQDETIKILVDDTILLRIKKASDDGLGSNIPTQSVLAFVCQEPDIPGLLPDIYKVEICYFEDAIGAEIASVRVTARDDDVMLWSYEICKAGPATAEIIPFPSAPGDDSPPDVTPRESDEDKKSDDEG